MTPGWLRDWIAPRMSIWRVFPTCYQILKLGGWLRHNEDTTRAGMGSRGSQRSREILVFSLVAFLIFWFQLTSGSNSVHGTACEYTSFIMMEMAVYQMTITKTVQCHFTAIVLSHGSSPSSSNSLLSAYKNNRLEITDSHHAVSLTKDSG